MYLKPKAYSFGVPLVYTITTISLFSARGCEPAAPSLQAASPVLRDAPSGSVRIHPPIIGGVWRWVHLGPKPGNKEPTLKNMLEPWRGAPEPGLEPRTSTSSKSRLKRRQPEERRPLNPHGPPGDCSKGHIKLVVPGRFYISGQFGPNLKHPSGSDGSGQGQEKQARSRGQHPSSSMESWQRLQPSVECGEDAMILTVRRKRATQLLLDRVNGSSLLLFQLPPQCGYFVQITPRDLSLKAQYDACHVTQEDGSFVLPLLWRGVPVKVSCPVSHNKLPDEGASFLCCSAHGVAFKLQELSAVKEPQINVRGEWTPLLLLVEQCGYIVKKRDEGIKIFVPFDTCGVTVKDGKQTLSLRIGKKIYTLSCPIQPLNEFPITHQPLADSPFSFTKGGPLLWVPPFYLAPPNYPHPTNPQPTNAQPKGRGFYNPPTTALAHGVVFSSQPTNQDLYSHQDPLKESYEHLRAHRPLSFKDQMKDSGRAYQEKQNREAPDLNLLESSAATTEFTVQAEVPPSQPPGHDFSSYYHHYHLPKILPPGAPQDPGPGAFGRLQSSTKSQHHKFSLMPPNNHQLKSLGNDASDKTSPQFINPTPYPFPTSPKVSSLPASYPLQLYPYYFFYLSHLKGEAKRLGLLSPDLAAKTNQSFASSYENHSMGPDINKSKRSKPGMLKLHDGSNGRGFVSVTPALQSPISQSYTHKPDPLTVPPPEQPFLPTPGFTYNADPHKYYYHPYYNNYQTYYAPEALHEKHNHGSQTLPRATAASSVQPSNHNPQSPRTESMNDVQKRLLHYYYSFYLPQLFKYNQKLQQHNAKKTNQASTAQLSPHLDFSKTQQSVLASEERHSSVPLSVDNPLKSLYSNFITEQLQSKPAEQHGGNGAQQKLVKEMKDGTAGQFLGYAVSESVEEPSVAPRALSSGDGEVSCMLQKLTSHPDVYVDPSDGCGVNQHVGQTKGNSLEVQDIQSHRDSSAPTPGRLMVGCGSSPDSPGGVRFQMDEPLSLSAGPPAVSVLLRIATDESFSSYYSEAHLPFSLLQNKPVHVELRLLEPSEPDMVLMVHFCLAYTATPEVSWMLFYDSCSSRSVSKLLPSSNSQHIQRIKINSFPSLPSESLTYRTPGGYVTLKNPEIYFLCLTEICSAAHSDCTVKCDKDPCEQPVSIRTDELTAGVNTAKSEALPSKVSPSCKL